MSLNIEVKDAVVLAALDRMLASGRNPRPYLDAIGNALAESTRLRFVDGKSPAGAPWAAVLRGGKPLRDTGAHLMNAVSHRLDSDKSVLVGVPYAWARVHQFGSTITAKMAPYLWFKIGNRWARKKSVTIPARPFLGVSAADRSAIAGILRSRILGA